MEKCINCESVYELEDRDDLIISAFCSKKCEDEYIEILRHPLEFK
jgi:ribosomal protein L24E